jgi:integrase
LQENASNRKNLVTPGTVNREVGLLRTMLNLASEWFDLELRPIKYEMAKEEPKERILTEQEIRRLIENSEKK